MVVLHAVFNGGALPPAIGPIYCIFNGMTFCANKQHNEKEWIKPGVLRTHTHAHTQRHFLSSMKKNTSTWQMEDYISFYIYFHQTVAFNIIWVSLCKSKAGTRNWKLLVWVRVYFYSPLWFIIFTYDCQSTGYLCVLLLVTPWQALGFHHFSQIEIVAILAFTMTAWAMLTLWLALLINWFE